MERAPLWFQAAVATPFEECQVEVEGCAINYLRWGDRDKPGLVLVHGGAAHAHWWSYLAPQLMSDYHIAALDLSGHGDSGHRDMYGCSIWSDEVMAVASDAGMISPIIVGHSMGGIVAIVAASLYGADLAGTIIVDSPVRRPDPESEEGAQGNVFRNAKTYPRIASALERFRLFPPQPCENGYIIDHIARHSLKEVENGWTWKFHNGVFQRPFEAIHEHLADVGCRIALFRAEYSMIVTPDVNDYMSELLHHNAPVVEIPDCHHHLTVDQPLAFLAALRAILADWEYTVPRLSAGADCS